MTFPIRQTRRHCLTLLPRGPSISSERWHFAMVARIPRIETIALEIIRAYARCSRRMAFPVGVWSKTRSATSGARSARARFRCSSALASSRPCARSTIVISRSRPSAARVERRRTGPLQPPKPLLDVVHTQQAFEGRRMRFVAAPRVRDSPGIPRRFLDPREHRGAVFLGGVLARNCRSVPGSCRARDSAQPGPPVKQPLAAAGR